jgi:hypothetical protein
MFTFQVLGRLFPVFAQCGVRRVNVCSAGKVEQCYFSTHFVNKENYEQLLLKGEKNYTQNE